MQKRLFLLDGMALVYRAHFALIRRPIFTSKGVNTSALFGFTQTLLDIIANQSPTHIAVAFDTEAPTQRHRDYPEYKIQREAMPEDLSQALPHVRRLIQAFNIPVILCDGYEADDIIGTLVRRAEKEDFDSYLVRTVKDFGQLVTPKTFLYKPSRQGDGIEVLGVGEILGKWGIQRPGQVIDILGLWGDASDNIPGVPGFGEKTASKLIAQYGSVENLLAHAAELKGKLKETLEANREQALLSKRLATINCDAPIGVDLEALKRLEWDEGKLRSLCAEFEFNSIGRRLFGEDFKAGRGFAQGESISGGATPSPGKPRASTQQDGDLFPLAPALSRGERENLPARPNEPGFARPFPTQDTASPLPEGEGQGEGDRNVQIDGAARKSSAPSTVESMPPRTSNLKTIADVPHEYRLIQNREERAELIRILCQQASFCFDTETTSLDPKDARLVGIAFSFASHTGCFVSIPQEPSEASAILDEFHSVFEHEQIEKVGHNLKFDLSVLKWQGVSVRGKLFDTMLAHSLIEPDMRHTMDFLAEAYLGYSPVPITALIGEKGPEQLRMSQVPLDQLTEYSAEDADVTWQLRSVLEPLLKEKGQERVFYEIEAPLLPVLVDMEFEGIRVDAAALAEFAAQLSKQIGTGERTIHRLARTEFNLNSPKQLGEVLFEVLKIAENPKKTKTGQYATDEQTLLTLAGEHEIVQRILEYRAMTKLKSTYADALPETICAKTGRVHTTYNQAVTATGRLQSQNPNLQNIPIRTELGQEIRKAFVPRSADYYLLSVDYSQIELRIIAALSHDGAMIEALRSGQDIHTATAAKVYGVALEQVTAEMRRKAKMVNYGIIYGMSAFGLSQRLGIPRKEAGEIIDQYFNQFPGIRKFIADTLAFAREHGFVQTVTGRRRYLRDIRSSNATVRSAAERNAINAPVQGSAADMIKIAMTKIHRELCRRKLKTRMLLQVHDELVFDLFKPEENEARSLIEDGMKTALSLDVPIVVEMGVGKNWLEAH